MVTKETCWAEKKPFDRTALEVSEDEEYVTGAEDDKVEMGNEEEEGAQGAESEDEGDQMDHDAGVATDDLVASKLLSKAGTPEAAPADKDSNQVGDDTVLSVHRRELECPATTMWGEEGELQPEGHDEPGQREEASRENSEPP